MITPLPAVMSNSTLTAANTGPHISVLLPVRTDSAYVGEAIESILAQSYGNYELLVLADPASDEATLAVVKAFTDSRIRLLVSDRQRTVGGILNFGLAAATGQIIARMDADDIALPERFELQVSYLESNPDVSLCGGWCELFGSESWEFRPPAIDEELKAGLMFGCVFLHPSVMWRAEEFRKNHLTYNESLCATEDYELWVRAAKLVRFGSVQQKLLRYRKHTSSATHKREREGKAIFRHLLSESLRANGYEFDESDLDFHYQYVTSGLANDGEIDRLRHWLHRLWLSEPQGQSVERHHAIGTLCAQRWYDACSNLSVTDKYAVLRSSALCDLMPACRIEEFRRNTRNSATRDSPSSPA